MTAILIGILLFMMADSMTKDGQNFIPAVFFSAFLLTVAGILGSLVLAIVGIFL